MKNYLRKKVFFVTMFDENSFLKNSTEDDTQIWPNDLQMEHVLTSVKDEWIKRWKGFLVLDHIKLDYYLTGYEITKPKNMPSRYRCVGDLQHCLVTDLLSWYCRNMDWSSTLHFNIRAFVYREESLDFSFKISIIPNVFWFLLLTFLHLCN